jgi:hypothetical protein
MRGYGLGTYIRSTRMRAPLAIASMRRKSACVVCDETAERVMALRAWKQLDFSGNVR